MGLEFFIERRVYPSLFHVTFVSWKNKRDLFYNVIPTGVSSTSLILFKRRVSPAARSGLYGSRTIICDLHPMDFSRTFVDSISSFETPGRLFMINKSTFFNTSISYRFIFSKPGETTRSEE